MCVVFWLPIWANCFDLLTNYLAMEQEKGGLCAKKWGFKKANVQLS